MGQKLGRAEFIEEARPFLNLPSDSVRKLWDAFNDVAEGFGLNSDEFKTICEAAKLHEFLATSRTELDAAAERIFVAFDTDENDLVDALEFLATFSLASGMSLDEKINFVFNCYDFDESGELTMDEMCLSFKSTLTGLCKLSGQPCPTELELEELAGAAFAAADSDSDNKISRQEFEHFCLRQPETATWLEFFDDLNDTTSGLSVLGGPIAESNGDVEATAFLTREVHPTLAAENAWATRSALQRRQIDVNARGVAGVDNVTHPARSWPWSEPDRLGKLTPSALEGAPPAGHTAPRANLELEWVHGYSGRTQRGNVRYTCAGEIVYPAARMGVVLNRTGRQQRFHMGHTDDVSCLAVATVVRMPTSPTETQTERTIVATGSVGERSDVIVWDADTCETLCTLRGVHRAAITHLDFSPDGTLLLSVGMDEDHTVTVHELPPLCFSGDPRANEAPISPTPIFADRGGKEPVFDARWVTATRFALCGEDFVRFWTNSPATRSYRVRAGVFGRIAKVETQTCLSPHPGRLADGVITGTETGAVLIWYGRNCVRSIPAHDNGPVLCLHAIARRKLDADAALRSVALSSFLRVLTLPLPHSISSSRPRPISLHLSSVPHPQSAW
jgi:Ca2+-binding EF-hand superfamily protein